MREPDSQRYPQSSLVACLLPWTADWQLDQEIFARHIEGALADGYKCLYILGTAGEGYAVSEALFRQAVQTFANHTLGRDCDPQVGIIGTSMQHVIERIGWAHGLGIRMFQISLPCWGPLDEDETLTFFETVCGTFPDCRFLHYNLPRARRLVTGVEYRRIADSVPNLVATKNNRARPQTQDILQHTPDLQHFLLDRNFAFGCTIAPCSLLCSCGVLFPKITREFFDAGLRRDATVLSRISDFLRDFLTRLFAHCRRDFIDGAYDKIYVSLRYPQFPTRLLPPYQGLSLLEHRQCREVYNRHYREADLWDFSQAAFPEVTAR